MNDIKVVALPGSRWECTKCGQCCLHTGLPLEPEDVRRLEELQAQDVLDQPATPWLAKNEQDNGMVSYLLNHRDGRCVFLQPEGGCVLHERFGFAAKPLICKQFPLKFVSLPQYLCVVVRPTCNELYKCLGRGADIESQAKELVRSGLFPRVHAFDLAEVCIYQQHSLPVVQWLMLEEQMLALISHRKSSLEVKMASLRQLLAENAVMLPEEQARYYRTGLATLLETLWFPLNQYLSSQEAGSGDKMVWFSDNLDKAWHVSVNDTPLPPLDRNVQKYIEYLLASEIMSKSWRQMNSFAAGMGLLLGTLYLIRANHINGPEPLDLDTFGREFSKWFHFLRQATPLGLIKNKQRSLENIFLFYGIRRD